MKHKIKNLFVLSKLRLFAWSVLFFIGQSVTLGEDADSGNTSEDEAFEAVEIQTFDNVQLYKFFNDRFYYVKSQDDSYGREWFVQNLDENDLPELLIDINSATNNGIPANLTEADVVELNNQLFFLANDGSTGVELWRTDGTEAGTQLVQDLDDSLADSGAQVSDSSTVNDPQHLRIFDNRLVFVMENRDGVRRSNGEQQTGLWISDGTEANTSKILDDVEELPAGRLRYLATQNNFYFITKSVDENKDYIIWRSNGESGGTEKILDEQQEQSNTNPLSEMTFFNDELYYIYNDQSLYVVDGLRQELDDRVFEFFRTDVDTRAEVHFSRVVNDTIIIAAKNDDNIGRELFVSDGRGGETTLLSDINDGPEDGVTFNLVDNTEEDLVFFDGSVYFPGATSGDGVEPWRTDGTEQNTEQVQNLASSTTSSNPRNFIEHDGDLYFVAEHSTSTGRCDYIYRIRAEDKNTIEEVIDTLPGSSECTQQIEKLAVTNDQLYFVENSGASKKVWRIDGAGNGGSGDGTPDGLVEFFTGHLDTGIMLFLLFLVWVGMHQKKNSRVH